MAGVNTAKFTSHLKILAVPFQWKESVTRTFGVLTKVSQHAWALAFTFLIPGFPLDCWPTILLEDILRKLARAFPHFLNHYQNLGVLGKSCS